MLALRLGEVAAFPFIDPPDSRLISDGYKLLYELQAVDDQRRITALGRQLARLPIDPRLGRMILAAEPAGCVREALIITSALAAQDPRERPLEHQQAADQQHRRFQDERSDFQALLNLWQYYHDKARELSKNQLRNLCRQEFISWLRMREWIELYRQLNGLVSEMGMRSAEPVSPESDDEKTNPALHQALLTGLLGFIGQRQDERIYLGAAGRNFQIFPGSGLIKKKPRWLMAAEVVETSRVYARTVAAIDPGWIERLAGHLVRRRYSEPRWLRKRAKVVASETVTLYGLPIVTGRQVNYGPIDQAEARQIFIRRALVEGELDTRAPFFRHNQRLLAEVERLEDKTRRRDIRVDDDTLYQFYDQRLPSDIDSGASFDRWRRRIERDHPEALYFDRQSVMTHDAAAVTAERFPDRLDLGNGLELPLVYKFEPTADDDGVTLQVPLAALNQIEPERLDWLVPGLLPERMAALLKAFPKSLRRHFVPVPDFVRVLTETLTPGQGVLTEAMSYQLHRMTGVSISAEAWQDDQIPAHLRMNIRVLDERGRTLAEGRDLIALRAQLRGASEASFAALPTPEFERDRISDWDFGDLPEQVGFVRNRVQLTGYPALVDEPDGLALRLLDTPVQAEVAHRRGLRRLIALRLGGDLKSRRRQLPGLKTMSLHYYSLGTQAELEQQLIDLIVDRAFLGDGTLPRSQADFERCLSEGRAQLSDTTARICNRIEVVLAAYHEVRKALSSGRIGDQPEALADIAEQLDALVYPGFIIATPYSWLEHLPRYLKAIELRLAKLRQAPDRDRDRRVAIQQLWQRYKDRREQHLERQRNDPELTRFRWMLEELRVSQFAQELKTAFPISVKRVEAQWDKIS